MLKSIQSRLIKKYGLSYTEIARLVHRYKSAISRKIAHNQCTYDGAYCAFKDEFELRNSGCFVGC